MSDLLMTQWINRINISKNIKIFIIILYCIVGSLGWFNYYSQHKKAAISHDNLSPQLTVSYVRSVVLYHSRGKLQELRSILLNDNLPNEKQIKTRITNILKHRSIDYIRDFNSITTPISALGDWYQNNFDFDSFLSEIFGMVFNKSLLVNEKLRDVSDVMEKYQNDTNAKLMEKLKIKAN